MDVAKNQWITIGASSYNFAHASRIMFANLGEISVLFAGEGNRTEHFRGPQAVALLADLKRMGIAVPDSIPPALEALPTFSSSR
jgi:hypothetical protein